MHFPNYKAVARQSIHKSRYTTTFTLLVFILTFLEGETVMFPGVHSSVFSDSDNNVLKSF